MSGSEWAADYFVSDGPGSGTKTSIRLDAGSEDNAHDLARQASRDHGEARVLRLGNGFYDAVAYYRNGEVWR